MHWHRNDVADNQNSYGGKNGDINSYSIDLKDKIPSWNKLDFEQRATIVQQYGLARDGWAGWHDLHGNNVYGAEDYEDYFNK